MTRPIDLPITMLEDDSGLVCGDVSPGAPMEHDLRQAALLQAKDALERSLEWHLCDKWRESRNLDQRDSWAHHHNMLSAALSAIEAVQEKGEKGTLVHLAACNSEGASGSDVPARPTSPAEEHAAFTAWARSMGFDVSRHATLGPEEIGFMNSHTTAAWQGWQRRATPMEAYL